MPRFILVAPRHGDIFRTRIMRSVTVDAPNYCNMPESETFPISSPTCSSYFLVGFSGYLSKQLRSQSFRPRQENPLRTFSGSSKGAAA